MFLEYFSVHYNYQMLFSAEVITEPILYHHNDPYFDISSVQEIMLESTASQSLMMSQPLRYLTML